MSESADFFLSGLSHEIRTPLNGIIGYNQLLFQTKLDSIQKTYLNSMNQCCIQLMQLINDILDFSKLATGKMHVNRECFTFSELINDVNSATSYRVKERKQKCTYILSKDLPEYVITDKGKVVQILINLLSNAIKFTDISGQIVVSIIPIEKSCIQFSIQDNGIGISPENQKKLFSAFFQVNENNSFNTGCGLGLSICKKIVNILEGEINVSSEKGKGSTFTFTIKYEPYDKFEKEVTSNSKILKDKHILMVDDNPDNRLILSEMLFSVGSIPIVCSSAKEALKLIEGKRFNFFAALLDICMPDISGVDLAKKIRELNTEIPLIALSSLSEPLDSPNFQHVLYKPYYPIKVIDTLSKIVGKNCIEECLLDEKSSDFPATLSHEQDKKNIKILIAEDIKYNTQMLLKMLESMGYYNIETVEDGEKAILSIEKERAKGAPYEILLLDLKMPIKSGFDVLEHIKAKEYTYPKIAVLTASVMDADKEKCKELGVKYFILKPIHMTHLKLVLKSIIYQSRPEVEFI